MKEEKIIPGTNVEASRRIKGGKTETFTGAVLSVDNNVLTLKLCKRVIFNPNKKQRKYDLFEITSSIITIGRDKLRKIVILDKGLDLKVAGWDDGEY